MGSPDCGILKGHWSSERGARNCRGLPDSFGFARLGHNAAEPEREELGPGGRVWGWNPPMGGLYEPAKGKQTRASPTLRGGSGLKRSQLRDDGVHEASPTLRGGSGLKRGRRAVHGGGVAGISHPPGWERIETRSPPATRSPSSASPTLRGGSGLKHRPSTSWPVPTSASPTLRGGSGLKRHVASDGQRLGGISHPPGWERIETSGSRESANRRPASPTLRGGSGLKRVVLVRREAGAVHLPPSGVGAD